MSCYQCLCSRFSSLVEVMLRVLISRPRNAISPSSMGSYWSDDELRLRRSRRSEYWSNLSVVCSLQTSHILTKLSCDAFNSHHFEAFWTATANMICMLPSSSRDLMPVYCILNDCSQHSCYFFICLELLLHTSLYCLLAADKYAWPILYCTAFSLCFVDCCHMIKSNSHWSETGKPEDVDRQEDNFKVYLEEIVW